MRSLLLIATITLITGTVFIILYFLAGTFANIISPIYIIIGLMLFIGGGIAILVIPKEHYHEKGRDDKKGLDMEMLLLGSCALLVGFIIAMSADMWTHQTERSWLPYRTITFISAGLLGFITIKVMTNGKEAPEST